MYNVYTSRYLGTTLHLIKCSNKNIITDNSRNKQQKRMDQRVAAARKGRCGDAINVSTARRSVSCTGQNQRPSHHYRPQTQHSSKHSLN